MPHHNSEDYKISAVKYYLKTNHKQKIFSVMIVLMLFLFIALLTILLS